MKGVRSSCLDIGRFPSLSAEAVLALTTLYREHRGWTDQLLHDNLRVTLAVAGTKCPSYPSVRRHLKAQGLLRQRPLRRASEGALAATKEYRLDAELVLIIGLLFPRGGLVHENPVSASSQVGLHSQKLRLC